MTASVNLRLLRKFFKSDTDVLVWLDLHDRLTTASVCGSRRELAREFNRPETSFRRFVAHLAIEGWIYVDVVGKHTTITLAHPPAFIDGCQAQSAAPSVIASNEATPVSVPEVSAPATVAQDAEPTPEASQERPSVFTASAFGEMVKAAVAKREPEPTAVSAPQVSQASPSLPIPDTKKKRPGKKGSATPTFDFVAECKPTTTKTLTPVAIPEDESDLRSEFATWLSQSDDRRAQQPGAGFKMWNHWRKEFSADAVESAVGKTMQRVPSPIDPIACVEFYLRNPGLEIPDRIDARQRRDYKRSAPAADMPTKPSLDRLASLDEMGMTEGLAEISRRNAALCADLGIEFK